MMRIHNSTTPFGQRATSLGQVAVQMTARAMPIEASADKWRTFQHIREARAAIGATDRALAILNALLSFYPENELSAEIGLVVWPSNEQLIARSNGMSPATLRRHLAVLVQCGLIIRRDSPNGKRFARKAWNGQVDQAFGFDLSPLLARAQEFQRLAETVLVEKRALRVARERVTLLRRDITKMIEAGLQEGLPGDWGSSHTEYLEIIARLPRQASFEVAQKIGDELEGLYAKLRQVLESFANLEKMNANESQNERHIQNSNPDSHKESEDSSRQKEEASGNAREPNAVTSLPKRDLPLGIVLDACTALQELAPARKIRHWRDFLATVEVARPMLGISPSAWAEALEVLGDRDAAITVAAIYQRSAHINNAGGYLRSLTDRAQAGKFSTWPMIMALLRARLETDEPALDTENTVPEANEPIGTAPREPSFQVSDALRKSLRNKRP